MLWILCSIDACRRPGGPASYDARYMLRCANHQRIGLRLMFFFLFSQGRKLSSLFSSHGGWLAMSIIGITHGVSSLPLRNTPNSPVEDTPLYWMLIRCRYPWTINRKRFSWARHWSIFILSSVIPLYCLCKVRCMLYLTWFSDWHSSFSHADIVFNTEASHDFPLV